VAWLRPEDRPAARPDRRPRRAGPRAAGALLAPWLRTAAGDLAPRLGGSRPLPAGVQLRPNRLVDEGAVEAYAERRFVEADGPAGRAEYRSVRHRSEPPHSRCAGRGPAHVP